MEIVFNIGRFEVHFVGREGDKPFEVWASDGGFLSAHNRKADAIAEAKTYHQEQR